MISCFAPQHEWTQDLSRAGRAGGAAAPRRERDCRTIEISRSHTAGWADRSPSDVAYAVRRTQRSMTGRQRAAARQLQLGCRVGSQIECSAYDRVHTYTPRREYVLCKRAAGRDRGDLSRLTVMDASATLVAVWPHVQDHEARAAFRVRACVPASRPLPCVWCETSRHGLEAKFGMRSLRSPSKRADPGRRH